MNSRIFRKATCRIELVKVRLRLLKSIEIQTEKGPIPLLLRGDETISDSNGLETSES